MDQIALWVTIAATVLIVAIAAGLWARDQAARPLVAGLGLGLIPPGLYLTGLTGLTINGIRSLVDWVQQTPWTQMMSWGVGLLVAGIVLFALSRFLKTAPKPERTASNRVQAPAAKPAVGRTGSPAPTATGGTAPAAKQPAAADEDAEIEEILRKRGIM